jgi:ferritin-like metal-binding protein YciE
MKSKIDADINALQPGERVEISRYNDIRCYAERSGDGRVIRFIRETPTGFKVYRSEQF